MRITTLMITGVLGLALAGCGGGGGGGGGGSSGGGGGAGTVTLTEYFPGTSVISGQGQAASGTNAKTGTWTYYNDPAGSLPDTPPQFAGQHYLRWTRVHGSGGGATSWIEYNNDHPTTPSIRVASGD